MVRLIRAKRGTAACSFEFKCIFLNILDLSAFTLESRAMMMMMMILITLFINFLLNEFITHSHTYDMQDH